MSECVGCSHSRHNCASQHAIKGRMTYNKNKKVAVVKPIINGQCAVELSEVAYATNRPILASQVGHLDRTLLAEDSNQNFFQLNDPVFIDAPTTAAELIRETATDNNITTIRTDETPGRIDVTSAENILPFYYPNLTMLEAKNLLKQSPEGTFLLRNSSEPRFAYSLSIKTKRGTTSVRILRTDSGQFRLDSDQAQQNFIPSFNSISELINYYLAQNMKPTGNEDCRRTHRYVFLERSGRMDTPLLMQQPLIRIS